MAREPSYPEDAPVGDPAPGDSAKSATADDEGSATPGSGPNRTRQLVTGAAIGIGSAALVAALLYANRSRKGSGSDGSSSGSPTK